MNLLLDSISNFLTSIINIYQDIPHELAGQLRTMQAFLKCYDERQLFLIQNFVKRLQAKSQKIRNLGKKRRDELKTQPDWFGQQNKQNINHLNFDDKQTRKHLLSNQNDDKFSLYRNSPLKINQILTKEHCQAPQRRYPQERSKSDFSNASEERENINKQKPSKTPYLGGYSMEPYFQTIHLKSHQFTSNQSLKPSEFDRIKEMKQNIAKINHIMDTNHETANFLEGCLNMQNLYNQKNHKQSII